MYVEGILGVAAKHPLLVIHVDGFYSHEPVLWEAHQSNHKVRHSESKQLKGTTVVQRQLPK